MILRKVPTYIKSIFWLLIFATLPFCLSARQEAKLGIVGHVNESSRIAFASKTLGHKRFGQLANIKPENGALEKFILVKIKKSLKGVIGVDYQRLTNAIIEESNDAGIDPLFVLSVIQHESRFRNDTIGTSGEIGLMQVMPSTASWLSEQYGIPYAEKSDLFDPVTNVRMGINYISWLREKFPKTKDLASAYNMGPKNLKIALNEKRRPKTYYIKVLKQYLHIYAEAQNHILATAERPQSGFLAFFKESTLPTASTPDKN